jgi:hypothetical protein
VIGFARQLADSSVLRGGDHARVHHILIGVKRGVLAIGLRGCLKTCETS